MSIHSEKNIKMRKKLMSDPEGQGQYSRFGLTGYIYKIWYNTIIRI